MAKRDIFSMLVRYHIDVNLPQCILYLQEGMVCPPTNKGRPVKEGLENKEYHGICIFKNGSTLVDKLVEDKLVNPVDVDEPVDVSNNAKFEDFLNNKDEEDGVYIYESASGLIYRIAKIHEPDITISDKIPHDFIFYGGPQNPNLDPEKAARRKLGTKTRLAISLANMYDDIDAYLIKHSGYTSLGIGKIPHFSKEGLVQEFFFRYDPNSKGPFVDEENHIIGVHRQYERHDSQLMRMGGKLITRPKDL